MHDVIARILAQALFVAQHAMQMEGHAMKSLPGTFADRILMIEFICIKGLARIIMLVLLNLLQCVMPKAEEFLVIKCFISTKPRKPRVTSYMQLRTWSILVVLSASNTSMN